MLVRLSLLTILPEFLRVFAQSDALRNATHFFTGGMSAEGQATALDRVQGLFANRMILYSLLLIALMLLRPQGLFAGWGRKGARK